MSVWCDSARTTRRRRRLWCVFACLCVLSFVSPCTLNINPPNNIYLAHGKNLNISCTSNCNLPSEDLQFTIGSQILPSRIIDNNIIQLYVMRPDVGRKVYICSSKSKKSSPVMNIVYVGPPPHKITDFNCIVDNFQSIDCTWSKPRSDDTPTEYQLTYAMNGAVSEKCNLKDCAKHTKMCCHLDYFTIPTYKPILHTYDFHLKATNELGVNEQFFSFNNYSIVKPKPVYNLIVSNISSRAVELNWQIDDVLREHTFPYTGLVYRIEYQIPTINDSYRNVLEVTMFTKNNNITYNLDQLPYAHMIYKVQILVKIAHESNNFWSKPCELQFETAGERPPRPPDLPPGAFDHSNYQGMTRRIVYAYWKQLEKYEEFGANFTYHLYITTPVVRLSMASHRHNRGYFQFESKSEDPINLTIWSKNAEGFSVNSSNMFIPAYEDTVDLRVLSFTIHSYENGTYLLMWKNSNKVDNYTIFWCTQHTSKICKDGIEYEIIDSRIKKYTKTLPNNANYQFALSANVGIKSSGMVWPKAECAISQDTIAMSDIKITLKYLNINSKTVKLFWSLDCIYDGIITGYNISYYFEDYECTGLILRKFVYISDANQWYVVINDLHPSTRYHVEINVDTNLGLKKYGHNTSFVTLEDTPSAPRNFRIHDIQNESLTISIEPPRPLNANVKHIKYVVYNNGEEIHRVQAQKNNSNDYEQITVGNLRSFTNYSLSVKAYNKHIGVYSDPTNSLFVRTRIGCPSKPMHVGYKYGVITWEPPKYPGGYVDQYLVGIITETGEEIVQQFNGTVSEYYVTLCKSESKGSVKYRVRAENVDIDVHHGALAFSDHVTLPVRHNNERLLFTGEYRSEVVNCGNDDNLFQLLSIIFAGFLSLFIIYGSLKLYRKYKDMADIDKPKLPLGIRLSEQRMVVKTDNILITMDLKIPNKEVSSNVQARNDEESNLCHKEEDELVNKFEGIIPTFQVNLISDNANIHKQVSASAYTENENNLPSRTSDIVDFLMPAGNGYVSATNVTTVAEPSGYVQAMPSISTSSILSNGTIKQPSSSDYVHHSVINNVPLDSDNKSHLFLRDDQNNENYNPDTMLQNGSTEKADLKPASNGYVSLTNVTDKTHTPMKPITTASEASGYVQAMPSISSSRLSNHAIKQPCSSEYDHHTKSSSDNRRNLILQDDKDTESYHSDVSLPCLSKGEVNLLKPTSNGYVSSDNVLNKLINILDSEHPNNVENRPSKDYTQFSLQMG